MSTPFHLHGKTILITGASSGIGSHTAWRITEMGGKVILSGRNSERLLKTAKKCNLNEDSIVIADISTPEGRHQLASSIPGIDGFVSCTGTVHPFPVRFLDQQKMDQTMNVNFEAPVLLTSALLKEKKIKAECFDVIYRLDLPYQSVVLRQIQIHHISRAGRWRVLSRLLLFG